MRRLHAQRHQRCHTVLVRRRGTGPVDAHGASPTPQIDVCVALAPLSVSLGTFVLLFITEWLPDMTSAARRPRAPSTAGRTARDVMRTLVRRARNLANANDRSRTALDSPTETRVVTDDWTRSSPHKHVG